jgi:hypothetical protein
MRACRRGRERSQSSGSSASSAPASSTCRPHSGSPGEPGGVPRAAAARRHGSSPCRSPTAATSPTARSRHRVGQVVQASCSYRRARAETHRIDIRRRSAELAARAPGRSSSSPAARRSRASIDFAEVPRDRRRASARISWSTWRISPGSIAAGPLPRTRCEHAHVATTTTHKTLRGPRGGLILTNDEALAKKFNAADLPRHPGRAADACHRRQGRRLRRGAATRISRLRRKASSPMPRMLAETLIEAGGLDIVTGGTDSAS